MGAYRVKQDDMGWSEVLERTEAGEEVEIEQNGAIIAKVIPFRATPLAEDAVRPLRPYGLKILGLNGDTSWLDEPLDEETQRAFGMID